MEADYDRHVKESQTTEGVTIRWDMGLNKKRLAYFIFPKADNELRLVPGDELRLRHNNPRGLSAEEIKHAPTHYSQWTCVGHVIKLTPSEEV